MLERNEVSTGQGSYKYIEKMEYEALGLDKYTPLMWAGALALPVGVMSGVGVGIALKSIGAGAIFGSFTMCASFVYAFNASLAFIADRELKSETYSNESSARAGASQSTITLELIEDHGQQGQIVDGQHYDIEGENMQSYAISETPKRQVTRKQLEGVNNTELALACQVEELSKRNLMDMGLSDSVAMSLVSQLLELGYLYREAQNKPAMWTLRGEALRYKLLNTGGGGGGGA